MSDPGHVDRRTILKLGACAVVPLVGEASGLWALADVHPLVPHQAGTPWAPRFLSRSQDEAVTALSERIIPATDTPGAAAVHVNQYIDWILGDADPAEQGLFRDGLAWLDGASNERFAKPFAALEPAQQDALLTPLAAAADAGRDSEPGVAFFRAVKQRTIEGYYRSEVGMKTELGYAGNTFLNEFEGCTHPEHLTWEPPTGAAGA